MEKIKVIIADDQKILAQGLEMLLSLEEDIEVIGIVNNGQEVLDKMKTTMPHVILMDIQMPVLNGVECTKLVLEKYPTVKILILTTFDDNEYIEQALHNGASGYMLKDLTAEKLSAAIRDVYHGNTVMDKKITEKIISNITKNNTSSISNLVTDSGEALTPRETEILKLLAEGLTNQEIAAKLYLSEGTVKNYITVLYDKTVIKGRTKLMAYAIQLGLH